MIDEALSGDFVPIEKWYCKPADAITTYTFNNLDSSKVLEYKLEWFLQINQGTSASFVYVEPNAIVNPFSLLQSTRQGSPGYSGNTTLTASNPTNIPIAAMNANISVANSKSSGALTIRRALSGGQHMFDASIFRQDGYNHVMVDYVGNNRTTWTAAMTSMRIRSSNEDFFGWMVLSARRI